MLSDYTSNSLDLSDRWSFRQLWKPMGALNEKRLIATRERRDALRSVGEKESPLYHTHYSAPAYVAHYLLRSFPELTVHIQSGKMDQPSRTFRSVQETWHNVSAHATGDIKELIPQFYSDPAHLINESGFAPSGDVELPPWANGSAVEFVRRMREGLESDHVSAHLHLWIDLIFGVKQVCTSL